MNRPSASTSSLSHWMTVRPGIVAFSMGTRSVHRLVAEQEAAGMDREVAREVADLARQLAEVPVRGRVGVQPGLRRARRARSRRERDRSFASRSSAVSGRPSALPTSRTAERGAVADDVGDHRGVVAAVLGVDVLDHLLAPLVLDVEVDVRRLGALAGEEALEEQAHPHGIDGGDPQAVADRGVRGRAAALAEDRPLPAEADDLPHREEVAAVVELVDEAQLLLELRRHVGGDRAAVALPGPGDGELGAATPRSSSPRAAAPRGSGSDLVEREGAARGDLARALDGVRHRRRRARGRRRETSGRVRRSAGCAGRRWQA